MVVLKISGRRTLGYGKYMLNKVDWLGFKLYNLDLLNQEFTIKIRIFWASIIVLSLFVFTIEYSSERN